LFLLLLFAAESWSMSQAELNNARPHKWLVIAH